MTDPLTAEWCHDVAMLYDGRAGLQRSARQYREATQDQKISAALRIAARVADEGLATRLKWIILKADDSEDAARQIAKYLREGSE